MKQILLFALVVVTAFPSCKEETKAQSASKQIHNKEFNWTITIPPNFDTVSAEQWAKMQSKGAEAIEKTYDQKIENTAKTIFVFKSDEHNYFESNYQPSEAASEEEYLENYKGVNQLLYGTFEAQMPEAKLDSISGQETIDGLQFQTFKVTITFPNNMAMDFSMFSRRFDNKEFTVNIMTIDKAKQEALLAAWRGSKFH